MKLSSATILFSISSASALSVNYLDRLNVEAPSARPANGGGIGSYLDNIGSQEEVPALVTALEQAVPPATPAEPAPSAGDYLSALNDSGNARSLTGAGLTSYLDTMAPNGSSPLSGSGITSYLDTMVPSGSSAAVAPPAALDPAPDASAPAADAPLSNDPPAAGDYLNALNTGTQSTSGAGITSYLDALPPGSRDTGGPGLTGYLEALTPSKQVSGNGPGLSSYVDAVSSDTGVPEEATGSFLESIYSQIMSLPDDGSRKISGDSMAFAKVDGPYAICFVKK